MMKAMRAGSLAWTSACCMVAALLAGSMSAEAKTLRWATRGDVQTMDPYSQNEGLTNNFANMIHDLLVEQDRNGVIGPRLATSWTIVNETTWRFNLRRGVKFHDGAPFSADDVVFSIERAQMPTSQLAQYARALGKVTKIDDYTIELHQDKPNPLLLEHVNTIYIMNKAWCIAHHVEKPLDYAAREETYASRNANGTGPYMLKTREPSVRTVLVRNPNWWGPVESDVTELVYTPIASDPTRMAALLSGEIDLVTDPSPQDIGRFQNNPAFKVITGPENRVVFFGFDQYRDALENSNVTGRNPFKDRRVREAFYKAIDVDVLQSKIMRGQAVPTGCMTTAPAGCLDAALERHPPADVEAAKKLMVEAGYPNGFELTLDCPNDRYINDRDLCIAAVGMLARIGVDAEGQRDAEDDLLSEDRPERDQHVHARLGRQHHRCADRDGPDPALQGSGHAEGFIQPRSIQRPGARSADRCRGRRDECGEAPTVDHRCAGARGSRVSIRSVAPPEAELDRPQQRHPGASREQRAAGRLDQDAVRWRCSLRAGARDPSRQEAAGLVGQTASPSRFQAARTACLASLQGACDSPRTAS